VAKLRKAARGKRRWVGLNVVESIQSREELEAIISEIACLSDNYRLYDFHQGKAIIRLPLEVYNSARLILQEGIQGIESVTSSGKIKLVRERMGIEVKRRKR
jgi:hypothetical protein